MFFRKKQQSFLGLSSVSLLLIILVTCVVKGEELSPTDLKRVKVGSIAPDFSLSDISGRQVTLSNLRGKSNVLLVFYRGNW